MGTYRKRLNNVLLRQKRVLNYISGNRVFTCRMIRTMRATEISSGCGLGIVSTTSPLHVRMFPSLIRAIKPRFPEFTDEFIPGKGGYLML
jgi:hypothetical protein